MDAKLNKFFENEKWDSVVELVKKEKALKEKYKEIIALNEKIIKFGKELIKEDWSQFYDHKKEIEKTPVNGYRTVLTDERFLTEREKLDDKKIAEFAVTKLGIDPKDVYVNDKSKTLSTVISCIPSRTLPKEERMRENDEIIGKLENAKKESIGELLSEITFAKKENDIYQEPIKQIEEERKHKVLEILVDSREILNDLFDEDNKINPEGLINLSNKLRDEASLDVKSPIQFRVNKVIKDSVVSKVLKEAANQNCTNELYKDSSLVRDLTNQVKSFTKKSNTLKKTLADTIVALAKPKQLKSTQTKVEKVAKQSADLKNFISTLGTITIKPTDFSKLPKLLDKLSDVNNLTNEKEKELNTLLDNITNFLQTELSDVISDPTLSKEQKSSVSIRIESEDAYLKRLKITQERQEAIKDSRKPKKTNQDHNL